MKGFPQMIWHPCAIFRVGPAADHYGAQWQYAVVVRFPWWSILRRLMGLEAVAPINALCADGNFKMAYAKPIQRWVRGLGFQPRWDRIKPRKDAE
jgi:hypothetical protein